MYRNLIKSMTPITNKEYEYEGAKAMEYSHVLHQCRFQYILDDLKQLVPIKFDFYILNNIYLVWRIKVEYQFGSDTIKYLSILELLEMSFLSPNCIN